MENGPHEEAEVLKENEDDDDELPSANSPSGEVEEDDEDEEPLHKRQRRRIGESALASSPAKQVEVENVDEVSESSSGDPAEPLVVPPLSSASPAGFARMPSVSLGSEEDDLDVTRLVLQPCRVCFLPCEYMT